MEASSPVDRVTRFAGTNKRSDYMKPSYSPFISLHEVPYSKYTHACTVGKSPKAKCLHGKIFASNYINTSPGNVYFFIQGELPGKASNSVNRSTQLHINRP